MDIEKPTLDSNSEMENKISEDFLEKNKFTNKDVDSKDSSLNEADILLFKKELYAKNSQENISETLSNVLNNPFKKGKSVQRPSNTLVNKESENKSSYISEQVLSSEFLPKPLIEKTNDTAYENKSMPLEISIDPAKITNAELPKEQIASSINNIARTHNEIISQQIKDQIIDRILVSTNDLELNKTVKIVLNPSLLENTQVNFQKTGQILSIEFETMNTNSLLFLNKNQADLQLYLQDNLKQFQDVSVRVKNTHQNGEQPEDGRSRNRYDYENLDDEEQ